MTSRVFTSITPQHIGKRVALAGWIQTRRDHGKLIFFDLRDKEGIVQIVCTPKEEKVYEVAQTLRPEWVVQIQGTVKERPRGMENPDLPTGSVEISVEEINVLSEAQTLPFAIDSAGYEIGEEKRLQYRYLDLRRDRLKNNLLLRNKVLQVMRAFLAKEGFVEIETPILTKSTPEGARDFVVPSRLYPGKFYALPQSPQQYKQLLQVAGFERYFQIARCFRDEDTRADRQPEFTQLDLEMSFIEQEDVLKLTENLYKEIVKQVFPTKRIQQFPFPRISYKEAMERYHSDKPDLRLNKEDKDELAFAFIVDFPMFEKKRDGSIGAAHHPFTLPKLPNKNADPYDYDHSRSAGKALREILKRKNPEELLTLEAHQYDVICNNYEVGGGSIRTHDPNNLQLIFEALGHDSEEVQEQFGHMLEAFRFGVPPHGGIALGIDRLIAILMNEPGIREVIAFPKTGDARDLMMNSPSELSPVQEKELRLSHTPRTRRQKK